MTGENKNEKEKILIREIPEKVYSKKMMLDERNNEEEKIHIREIPEQVYSMEMLDERNNENNIEEEKILFREMLKEEYKIMVDERKEYENNKVEYRINRIYRKCGLKKLESYKNLVRKDISLIEIEKLINEMNEFNYENEKNENLYKINSRFHMIKKFKFIDLETERVKALLHGQIFVRYLIR